MSKEKIDTRAIGLDVGLEFVRWLTGSENLHYGYWDGLDVTAGNLRAAQEAYTAKLFGLLPKGKLRILDIGGGAGATARKLLDLGHEVVIVVPSSLLAERCRKIAPEADVHECTFEEYFGAGGFDLCLFSESYQYIPLDAGVPRCLDLLTPNGEIIISDCFRSDVFKREKGAAVVGGGHPHHVFRQALAAWPVEIISEEDITQATAPSVDIEQGLFNVLGSALTRIDEELEVKRPKSRWALDKLVKLFLNDRARSRLDQRLNQSTRNRTVFAENNVYLMMKLRRSN
ncbi:MAG: methyltransferase domain-containing protein [Pseudomonadota bacterium]